MVAPRLKRLVIETYWLEEALLPEVLRMQTPELEQLELWFGDEFQETRAPDVEKLLMREWPRLKSLGLRNASFSQELMGLVARSKLLPQLNVLDLSLGAFSDADADALIDRAAAFSHLATLSFDENQLCTSLPRLRQAFPNATFEEQRELDDDPCVAVNGLSDLASRS